VLRGVDAMLPWHYSPVPCSVDSGFARVTDELASTLITPSDEDNPRGHPGAGSIPPRADRAMRSPAFPYAKSILALYQTNAGAGIWSASERELKLLDRPMKWLSATERDPGCVKTCTE